MPAGAAAEAAAEMERPLLCDVRLVREVVLVISSELFWLRAACSARSCTGSGAGLDMEQGVHRLPCTGYDK
jgi:hypothetical protein